MPRTAPRRRRSPNIEAFLGIFIPLLFAAIAVYQEVVDGRIDKYIIGALLVFGLGSLGWRIDVLLEKWLEARGRGVGGGIGGPADPQDDK